jgi:hypothetical protein
MKDPMNALNATFKIAPLLRNRRRKQKVADWVAPRCSALHRESMLEQCSRR